MARLGAVDDRALGTSVRVVVTDAGRLAVAKRAVDVILRDIDLACSRFREDSDLAALNRSAGAETTVGPLLARALAEGLRGARVTDGDVTPRWGRRSASPATTRTSRRWPRREAR